MVKIYPKAKIWRLYEYFLIKSFNQNSNVTYLLLPPTLIYVIDYLSIYIFCILSVTYYKLANIVILFVFYLMIIYIPLSEYMLVTNNHRILMSQTKKKKKKKKRKCYNIHPYIQQLFPPHFLFFSFLFLLKPTWRNP